MSAAMPTCWAYWEPVNRLVLAIGRDPAEVENEGNIYAFPHKRLYPATEALYSDYLTRLDRGTFRYPPYCILGGILMLPQEAAQ